MKDFKIVKNFNRKNIFESGSKNVSEMNKEPYFAKYLLRSRKQNQLPMVNRNVSTGSIQSESTEKQQKDFPLLDDQKSNKPI